MALIVETGAGVPDVESLCSVAQADAYHEGRGNTAAWAPLDTETKEQLLRRAYDYLVGEYSQEWACGVPFGTADGAVPRGMVQANAQLALYAKNGPLDPEVTPQKIKTEVGPIKSEYAERTNGGRRVFPDVARMVGPCLPPLKLYSVKLERA